MAAPKNMKKKQTKATGTTAKNIARLKKATKRKPTGKRNAPKQPANKKGVKKRPRIKTKSLGQKAISAKPMSGLKKQARDKLQTVDTVSFPLEERAARSGGQSGDLQGLSGSEGADSESVEELLDEGNAFEADVITGVEEAGDADESEVRTREVLADDVPDEYLNKD